MDKDGYYECPKVINNLSGPKKMNLIKFTFIFIQLYNVHRYQGHFATFFTRSENLVSFEEQYSSR